MTRHRGRALLALAVLVGVAAGCSGRSPTADAGSSPGPTRLAPCSVDSARDAAGGLPALRLACLGAGPTVDVGRLAGPAVVNMWASWCYPCKKELPLLQKASTKSRPAVHFVGVDTNDSAGSARSFLRSAGATYEELSDPTGKLATALHAAGLPLTVAVDRDGAIAWRKAGKLTDADLAAAVRAAKGG